MFQKNMKIKFYFLLIAIIFVGLAWGVVNFVSATPDLSTRKIIVFKSGVLNEPAREALIQKFGGVKIKHLNLIDGTAVLLPPKVEKLLARETGILRIDDDVEIFALEKPNEIRDFIKSRRIAKPTPQPTPQPIPWGINRIDAEKVWSITTGDPVKVAVVDTGINLAHPDLKANIKGGYNAIYPSKSADDDNGHGTHVAGIIAALNNNIGVVGVGPQIHLYAVKVLSRTGSAYLSDVIEGLDWAIQNGMQVVNMSLGTSADILSFHEAIQRADKAGIIQVTAAGNSGGAVNYPAAYPEVIAVSATDNTDTIAYWSSRGLEIDLAAPGVNVYSTYWTNRGSTYNTLSGTSMASPHVAGVAALLLTVPTKCDQDLNGKCSPAEVQQRLEATADDLGAAGKDNLYGSGLVNALKAITQ